MPLFTKCIVLTRFTLYWISYITSAPNDFIINDAKLTYGEFQLWRLFLSPLLVTGFWFDLFFCMTVWLCFFCYVREYNRGTLTAFLYFNLINIALQLVSFSIALFFSLFFRPYSDTLVKDSAFFNIFVVDVYQAMLANPNKPIDMLFCKIAQKYFALVVLFFAYIVLPYDSVSIAAVVIVGTTLHFLRQKDILFYVVSAFERLIGCGKACTCTSIGYITAEAGKMNAQSCTDEYVPFNRRQIKGHIRNSSAYR